MAARISMRLYRVDLERRVGMGVERRVHMVDPLVEHGEELEQF
jgi:hypothetical protein